jgi:hypothetical protein
MTPLNMRRARVRLTARPHSCAALLRCDTRRAHTTSYPPEPDLCAITARSDAYGDVVNLRRLHWRAWGERVAKGRGAEVNEPVTVRAWRLRPVSGDARGVRAYTRLRISSDRGVVTVRRAAWRPEERDRARAPRPR